VAGPILGGPVAPSQEGNAVVLEVRDLSLSVPGRRLLKDANLSIRAGECVAITGPSGAGKTSLLNCVAGISTPEAGVVEVDGVELSRLPAAKRSSFRLRRIGMVFQFGELLPELTARENVALPARLAGMGREETAQLAGEWLNRFGLGEQMDAHPESMSGGEQQRVGLARALAHRPVLLLADEPTGMLDERNTDLVVGMMIEAARDLGTAVLIATHDSTVAAATDRTLRLHDCALHPTQALLSDTSRR